MPLRLSAEGVRVIDEWLKQRCKSSDDEQLVAEVLRAVANRSWQLRWCSYKNEAEPDITTIRPRDGLFIHIRLWTEDVEEFTVVSVTDLDAPAGE